MAHALEEFQRRQAPDNVTHFAHAQQPLFPKKHQAEDTGQRETRVCEDAERDVQGEDDAMGLCRRSGMLGRQGTSEKKCQDDRNHESANSALAVIDLQAKISNPEEPAKGGYGNLQVMLRKGMHESPAAEASQMMER